MLPITRGVNLHAFTSHNSPKQSLKQHPVDFCWKSCSWNLVSHFEGLKFGYFTIWNVEEPGNMRSNTKTSTPWGIVWTFIFSTQHQWPLVPWNCWSHRFTIEKSIHAKVDHFLGGKAPSNLLSQNGRYLLIKESPVRMWDGSMKWFFLVHVVGILYEFS